MAISPTYGGRDHFREFDLDSPEFNEHYDEVNQALLEKCPVAHSEVGIGYYVVSRQADVRRVAQDWQTFSSEDGCIRIVPRACRRCCPRRSIRRTRPTGAKR